jgi:hypothetical protein
MTTKDKGERLCRAALSDPEYQRLIGRLDGARRALAHAFAGGGWGSLVHGHDELTAISVQLDAIRKKFAE